MTQESDGRPLAERVREAAALLEALERDRSALEALDAESRARLHRAVDAFAPSAKARRVRHRKLRRAERDEARAQDEAVLHATGIRALRRRPVFTTPNVFPPAEGDVVHEVDDEALAQRGAREPRACYVCKQAYTTLHVFYDQLCPACAELNFFKRTELTELRGRVALLTGGRVKIGYQAGLKLLRCGAELIVTTRFPRDAASRYAAEPDFEQWCGRLRIHGLDLRHTPSVEAFCDELLRTQPRLDFIVNNACQTVRRPPAYYAHMLEAESTTQVPAHLRRLVAHEAQANASSAEDALAVSAVTARSVLLSQRALLPDDLATDAASFPEGRLDQDLQQVDLRRHNSWRMRLHEVSTVELLEVQLVNAIAPYVLNARLKPLLARTPERDKHIVNVSAMEGQFYRRFKTTRHPHTNMAKAALNMMTRTAAADYVQDGIHMNAVDTGWITDEDPVEIAERKTQEQRFHPPLDIVDGAARIVDPIIAGFNSGVHLWGKFLKDYRPTDW